MSDITTLELDDAALAEVRSYFEQLELDDPIVTLIETGPRVEQVWVDRKRARFVVTGPGGWDIGGWSAREFFGDAEHVVQTIGGIPFGFESAAIAESFSGKVLTHGAEGFALRRRDET